MKISRDLLQSNGVSLYDQIVAETNFQVERDGWALMRWGKHWADCDEFEQSEVMRLWNTPIGGGYEPIPRPEAT